MRFIFKRKTHIILGMMIFTFVLFLGNSNILNAKNKKISSIQLSNDKMTVYIGQTRQLAVKQLSSKGAKSKLIWKSSNSKVAKVSKNGKVTGVKKGNATVTVMLKNNPSVRVKCKINVVKYKEVTLKGDITIIEGSIPLTERSGEIKAIYSRKELKKYLPDIKELDEGTYKKYKQYNSAFFKDNYIIISGFYTNYIQHPRGGESVVKQNKDGKMVCETKINCVKSDTDGNAYPAVMVNYIMLQDVSRKEANQIDYINYTYTVE